MLIYLTGHGGDGFLKFQDAEELTNQDVADAIETMWQQNRLLNLGTYLILKIDIMNCYSLRTLAKVNPCTREYIPQKCWPLPPVLLAF